VDVVDGARVKGVLGCPSVPGGREGVKWHVMLNSVCAMATVCIEYTT
jgi:hypothetical protein